MYDKVSILFIEISRKAQQLVLNATILIFQLIKFSFSLRQQAQNDYQLFLKIIKKQMLRTLTIYSGISQSQSRGLCGFGLYTLYKEKYSLFCRIAEPSEFMNPHIRGLWDHYCKQQTLVDVQKFIRTQGKYSFNYIIILIKNIIKITLVSSV